MTSRYAEVLRAPHVVALLTTALIARLPIGIEGLATVLFLAERTGSFGVAGLVAGALVVGSGIGAPVVSRLIDRLGARRVLLPVAAVHAVALLALVILGYEDAPTVALMIPAAAAGLTVPPTSSVLRSLWPGLLADRKHVLASAYALDSVLIEMLFILGPLVTAGLVAVASPAAALGLSAVAVAIGTTAFSAIPPARDHRSDPDADTGGFFGALATPGMRTLVLTSLPLGMCLGAIEVTLPAFGDGEGAAAWGGVLLAVWSIGSAAGGLAYGARERHRDLVPMWLVFVAGVPLGMLPMLAAQSVWSMLFLCIPAGLAIAPMFAVTNQLVVRAAPPGSATEAFTWPLTATVAGIAAGTALAGSLADSHGWRAGVLFGVGAGLFGIVAAALRRRTLERIPELATAVP
jgi:MFS family permease